MRRIMGFVLLLRVCCPLPSIQAQGTGWRAFTLSDGLPSDSILALAEDARGQLWVGGEGGLAALCGRGSSATGGLFCLPFPSQVWPEEIALHTFQALLPTPDGGLWVGGSGGLHRQTPDGQWLFHLESLAGIPGSQINTLLFDASGMVWAGAFDGGLAVYNPASQTWRAPSGFTPRVAALAQDSTGRIWIAGPDGITLFDPLTFTVLGLVPYGEGSTLPGEPYALLAGDGGAMWVGTSNGLAHFTGLQPDFILSTPDGLSDPAVLSLRSAAPDGLWAGTAFGLNRIESSRVTRTYTRADGLPGDRIQALLVDSEGSLWAATESGLARYQLEAWQNESFSPLQAVEINAILVDDDSDNLIGTSDGLVRGSPGRWQKLELDLPDPEIRALTRIPSGGVFVGTRRGLAYLEGEQLAASNITCPYSISALAYDAGGALWIGTPQGAWRFSLGQTPQNCSSVDPVLTFPILAFWQGSGGALWVGTANRGAYAWLNGTWRNITWTSSQQGLADDFIYAGLQDSTGNLWFGTRSGLSRLSAGADFSDPLAWRTFAIPDLASNEISALSEGSKPGSIWVGTRGGLHLLLGEDEPSLFSIADGLPDKRITVLAQPVSGTLWIGTAFGLSFHTSRTRPPLLSQPQLTIGGRLCDDQCLQRGLPYNTPSGIVRFSAADLGDLDGVRFRYTLVKTESEVASAPVSEVISDTSLELAFTPSTTFTLTLSALDRDFNESIQAEPLVIKVRSPSFFDRLSDPRIGIPVILLASFLSIAGYRLARRGRPVRFADILIVFSQNKRGPTTIETILPPFAPGSLVAAYDRLRQFFTSLRSGSTPTSRQQAISTVNPRSRTVDSLAVSTLRRYVQQLEQEVAKDQLLKAQDRQHLIGWMLYQVIASPELEVLFKRMGRGLLHLRLRLEFRGSTPLAILPWELIYQDNLGFVAQRPDFALVRYQDPPDDFRRPLREKTWRVLVVLSQPQDASDIRVEDEKNILDGIIGPMKNVQLAYVSGPNAASRCGIPVIHVDLTSQLRERLGEGWDILHWIGHAGPMPDDPDPATAGRSVLWSEDQDGYKVPLPPEELGEMLRTGALADHTRMPRLVVLNACRTADTAGALVGDLLKAGVCAVTAMQWPINSELARLFSAGYYSTLVHHGQVDYAASVGRNRIASAAPNLRDWAAPVVILQVRDGRLFEPD